MNLQPTEEQLLIQKTTREYAQRSLAPRAAERDVTGAFPEAELRELAELGLLGINVPSQYGGAEAGVVAYSLALTELARADASVAVAVSVTNMVGELVSRYGTEEQKKRHLPKLTSGEYVSGAFALSEPQAGSDAWALATTAEKIQSGWRLRGSKQWITTGDRAGLLVVWAITEKSAARNKISAFLVEGGQKGLIVDREEDKMGLRGSSTVALTFDDLEVSSDAVLGELGEGFQLAMRALDGGRIGIASQALGIAQMAFDAALDYSQQRHAFGRAIIEHQAIGNMLADSATWMEAARLLIMRAAAAKEQGRPYGKLAAMAKLFASEKAGVVCDLALQIHGGYGYTRDFPVERACRDVRVTRIYEGTSEIQRLVIARHILKEASRE